MQNVGMRPSREAPLLELPPAMRRALGIPAASLLSTALALGSGGCKRVATVSSGRYGCVTASDCAWGWRCERGDASLGRCATGHAQPDGGSPCPAPTPACALQEGVCAAAAQPCGPDGRWIACGEGDYRAHARSRGLRYEPAEKSCDREDNDCDGEVDEPPATCCQPACAGKACGASDGCGGSCRTGSCGAHARCEAGGCVCSALSCDGACCAAAEVCAAGACCSPTCSERVCGPDPSCGASCGRCAQAEQCDLEGRCSRSSWVTLLGKVREREDFKVHAIATDERLHTYVAGQFSSTVTLAGQVFSASGQHSGYLLELGPTGEPLWATVVAGTDLGAITSVTVGRGGDVFIGGYFTRQLVMLAAERGASRGDMDGYVAKLSRARELVWVRLVGGSGQDGVADVVVDSHGNLRAAGLFADRFEAGGHALEARGESDLFVLQLDGQSGAVTWASAAGGSGATRGYGLAVDSRGNSYVAGAFSGHAIFGAQTLRSAGADDAFLCKLDETGRFSWSRRFGGVGVDGFDAVAVSGVDSVTAAGHYESLVELGESIQHESRGNYDVLVARFGSDAATLWATSAGSAGPDIPYALALEPDGGVFVTGLFAGDATFGDHALRLTDYADLFVGHLSPAGLFTHVAAVGGKGLVAAMGIVLDRAGNLQLAGTTQGATEFDGKQVDPELEVGGVAGFVWSFGPDARW